LILDEPTSALDGESERRIRSTITELKGRVTLVIVAHRLSTLEVCDRVISIEAGRISGSRGT
jgi:ABC-type multidrug transport system fused ATPase/permease subunit